MTRRLALLAATMVVALLASCGGGTDEAANSQRVRSQSAKLTADHPADDSPSDRFAPAIITVSYWAEDEDLCEDTSQRFTGGTAAAVANTVWGSQYRDCNFSGITFHESFNDGPLSDFFLSKVTLIPDGLTWFVLSEQATAPQGVAGRVIENSASPYGTIACPSGYAFPPELMQSVDGINSGTASVLEADGDLCKFSTKDVLPEQNLGRPQACSVGDPINQATGNKYEMESDFVEAGFGLELVRFYNSDPSASVGMFGAHWTTGFDRHLAFVSGDHRVVEATRSDGRRLTFVQISDGSYQAPPQVRDRLAVVTDASGATTGWRYTSVPSDEVEIYAANGQLQSSANRAGLAVTFAYDPNGHMTKATDAFGRSLSFQYAGNFVTTVIDPALRQHQYAYDADSNLRSATHPGGETKSYLYNEPALMSGASWPHAMTGVVDELTNRLATFKYDAAGRATFSERAGQTETTSIAYTLDSSGTVTAATVTLAGQSPVIYTIGVNGGQARPEGQNRDCGCSSGGANVQWEVDDQISDRTDFSGVETAFQFDLDGNVTRIQEAFSTPDERDTSLTWSADFHLPTQVIRGNQEDDLTYDPQGNLTQRTVTDTSTSAVRSWSYTYYPNGQLATVDGPRTDVVDKTSLTYDEQGNLATMSDAMLHVTKWTSYNAAGLPLSKTDANGVVTSFAYDSRDRMYTMTTAGEATNYRYDKAGQLTQVILPSGTSYALMYDAAHRLTDISDSAGGRMHYAYDQQSHVVGRSTYQGQTLLTTNTSKFDTLGRLAQIIGANGQTTTLHYDVNDLVSSVEDPLHNLTSSGHDPLGRIRSIIDATSGVSGVSHDALNQTTGIKDPNANDSTVTPDGLGNIAETTLPAPDAYQRQLFDSAGNVTSRTDFRGIVATYTYDALNRLTSAKAAGATINYGYDEGSNGVGRLTHMTDASGTTRFAYDALGRITSIARQFGTITPTTRFAYTSGRLSSITYPSGRVVGYASFDERVSAVTVDGQPFLSSIVSRPFGPVQSWTWASGASYLRQFDGDGRLTDFPLGSTSEHVQYDNAGDLASITDSADSSRSQAFGYDALGRVTGYTGTSSTGAASTQAYGYDSNGNRTSQTFNGVTTSNTYAPQSNFLVHLAGPVAKTWGLTSTGAISDGSHQFMLDGFDRVAAMTAGASTYTYLVNGIGQRVTKSSAGATTHFVYGLGGELLSELDATGHAVREYVWLGEAGDPVPQPVGVSQGVGGAVNYVFGDQINSPRLVTTSAGVALWRWSSDPWGAGLPQVNANGFAINLRFPGQYYDAESGLHYNWHRYYDPSSGRYAQSDPIGLDGGINSYVYAHSAPTAFSDRSGLSVDPDPNSRIGPPWLVGTFVHSVFSEIVRGMGPQYGANTTLNGLFGSFRPDAFDTIEKQIWELKPPSCIPPGPANTAAMIQLRDYQILAAANDPGPGDWSIGAGSALLPREVSTERTYYDGSRVEIRFFADQTNPVNIKNGLVFYEIEKLQSVGERVREAIRDAFGRPVGCTCSKPNKGIQE